MTNRSLSSTLDRMWTLNRALDQALSAGFDRASRAPQLWVPAMDVAEKADAYLINVELPGVEPSQVEINFEQNVLTIRGTKPRSFETEGEYRVYTAERVSGDFERSVRLPDFVDSERIEASYRSEEHTLNSSHANISYAVFCLKKTKTRCTPYHGWTLSR